MSGGAPYQDAVTASAERSMTQQEMHELMLSHWQFRWEQKIKIGGPPLVIALGTFGNILSLLVLLRPRMRVKSTFLYLAGVAAADLVFLWFNPLRSWIENVGDYELLHSKDWACKTVIFLGGASSHYSVWLLVLVTAERFIVIVNPLRGPLVCRRSRALIAMVVLLVVVVLVNVHLLFTYGVTKINQTNTTKCGELPKHRHFTTKIWTWIDPCIYSIIPFFVILSLNVLIIVSTRGAGRMRRTLSTSSTHSQNQDDAKRLTLMLLTLTFTFLLTTSPTSIYMIYLALKTPRNDTLWISKVLLARVLCMHIMWINHAVNFFLYCLVGKKFRKELWQLIHCQWKRTRLPTRTSTMTTHFTASVRKEHFPLQQTEFASKQL